MKMNSGVQFIFLSFALRILLAPFAMMAVVDLKIPLGFCFVSVDQSLEARIAS